MPLEGVNLPPRKPGKHAIQDEDVARAKRLREALVKHHLVSSPRYSARKWATEFRRVVNLREATEEEVDQVLTWYCDQAIPRLKAGDPVLQVLSGAAFYEKWDQLKLAHERSVRDNPTVEITDLGRQIGTSLLHLKWPKGSDADLYTAVQLTLDTYRAFLRRLGKVASRPEHVRGKKGLTRDRVRDLADYLSGVLSSPATFTVNWIKDVHQKAVYAKQAHGSWKGSLVKSALRSVDDKDFKAMVEGAAGRYGAGESTLAKLWEEIK